MYILGQSESYTLAPALPGGCNGLGCACGGTCGGLGLFDSGMDYSAWGWPEYLVIGLGVYALASTVFTTAKAGRYVAGSGERRRKARVKRISDQLKDARRK